MSISDKAISIQGLSKSYDIVHVQKHDTLAEAMVSRIRRPVQSSEKETFWALKDVTFDVDHGEVVGVVGHNGAGKSTLLKVLSRITEPTTGKITLRGRVGSLLEVGTGFHPELTGRENIYMNGAILGMTRRQIDSAFDSIVDFSGTEQFLDTPVKRYSSGMYVRLAFAVAAHLEPEILVVDEVLAVGDAEFQKKCLGKMDEVARTGRTVLLVSHNMGVVNNLCKKCVYLKKGRVEMYGDTSSIVGRYISDLASYANQDLKLLRLPGYGKQIRFAAIEGVSNDADGVTAFEFGKPLVFKLTVQADIAEKGLSVAGSVFDKMGAAVGTFFNRQKFDIAAGESLEIQVSIEDVPLAPGSYHAGFSLGMGGNETSRFDHDIVIGMPQFEVLTFSNDGDSMANWVSNWGSIVFDETRAEIISRELVH